MQKISDSTTSANANGEFTEGNPGAGIQATLLKAAWLNAIQRELVNVITAAGISLDAGDDSQVLKAIRAILATASNWVALQGKPTTLLGFGITDAYTKDQIDSAKAPLASPALTGVPTAPTAAASSNSTQLATTAFVKAAVNAVIDAAPGALDTLKELADALDNDPNFATTITSLIGGKANKETTLDGYGITDAARASDLLFIGGVSGSGRGVKLSATGLSSVVSVAFDELVVSDGSGKYRTLKRSTLGLNLSTIAANGLDSGAVAASTWYDVWVISSASAVAVLGALSGAAPTMPAGYTHKALVGVVRTDATANKYPLSFQQTGRIWQYKVAAASNLAAMPLLASGVGGNPSVGPTWSTLAIGNFAPPSASEITLVISTTVAGATAIIVAPNNSYGVYNSPTNPPPGGLGNGSFLPGPTQVRFALEGANICWAADRAESRIYITSFELNL